MFNSRRILIVEDEPFVVIELVEAVERSGGAVVGPVPTVAEALALLDQHKIDAAILDVQLLDGEISPVALRLIEQGTPLVFQTGTGLPVVLVELDIELVVVLKPVAPMIILALLLAKIMRQTARQVG